MSFFSGETYTHLKRNWKRKAALLFTLVGGVLALASCRPDSNGNVQITTPDGTVLTLTPEQAMGIGLTPTGTSEPTETPRPTADGYDAVETALTVSAHSQNENSGDGRNQVRALELAPKDPTDPDLLGGTRLPTETPDPNEPSPFDQLATADAGIATLGAENALTATADAATIAATPVPENNETPLPDEGDEEISTIISDADFDIKFISTIAPRLAESFNVDLQEYLDFVEQQGVLSNDSALRQITNILPLPLNGERFDIDTFESPVDGKQQIIWLIDINSLIDGQIILSEQEFPESITLIGEDSRSELTRWKIGEHYYQGVNGELILADELDMTQLQEASRIYLDANDGDHFGNISIIFE